MANKINELSTSELNYNEDGLIPAIIQDVQSRAVLMLAWMNETSLQKTLDTGETWFWSRSRGEFWHKGATSGNVQKVREIRYDCDQDTLLVLVEPAGPACHEGTYTCFEQRSLAMSEPLSTQSDQGLDYEIFSKLMETIARREAERPEGAYTTYLFEEGLDKILKKVGEEASEVIIASKNRDHEELRNESADLLYHLFVLWREQGLGFEQIIDILKKRHFST